MRPIEHLLLAAGVLVVFLSVGAYYHLTLQKQVRARQAEVAAVREDLTEIQKSPPLAEFEPLRARIWTANRAQEQRQLLRQVRRFSRLTLTSARLTVKGSEGEPLCERLRSVQVLGRPAEPELSPDGAVTVSF